MKSATATMSKITLTVILLLMLIASMGGQSGYLQSAVAEPDGDTPHPPSIVNMTSPYMNEKGMVKAYHKDLIFIFNAWTNQSKSYLIMGDTLILAEGNFTYHKVIVVDVKVKIIRHLKVYIDDNLSLERTNMIIYNKQYYDSPDGAGGGTFLGYSWEFIQEQKWQIFRAGIVAGVIGILLAGYEIQYWYRRRMGEEIVVSSI